MLCNSPGCVLIPCQFHGPLTDTQNRTQEAVFLEIGFDLLVAPILIAQAANCLVNHIGDYYPGFVTEVGHIVTNDSVIDSGVDLTS